MSSACCARAPSAHKPTVAVAATSRGMMQRGINKSPASHSRTAKDVNRSSTMKSFTKVGEDSRAAWERLMVDEPRGTNTT